MASIAVFRGWAVAADGGLWRSATLDGPVRSRIPCVEAGIELVTALLHQLCEC